MELLSEMYSMLRKAVDLSEDLQTSSLLLLVVPRHKLHFFWLLSDMSIVTSQPRDEQKYTLIPRS